MPKTKLTITIDEKLKKELKMQAIKEDTTASQIIENCVKKYLKK